MIRRRDYRAWTLLTAASALSLWQTAQDSPKGAVLVRAWMAASTESWQPRQAAAVGRTGLQALCGQVTGVAEAGSGAI